MDNEVIKWLLSGDPSVVFQTMRDLTNTSREQLKSAQEEIALHGWGADLLARQDRDGQWAGSIYSPKWISTHYTLMLLMQLGLSPNNPQARKACGLLLDKGFYRDGGINHWKSWKRSETCVTAMTLAMLCYFQMEDDRIFALKSFLDKEQMPDGGWNCEKMNGARHSSMHTTLSVLESFEHYKRRYNPKPSKREPMVLEAHEFLLTHHLFLSDKTGKVIDTKMTRFTYPPGWRYDIFRALDYFQSIDAPHDPRFCQAIRLLKKKEQMGRWNMEAKHPGKYFFDLEPAGKPGRVNTLRALRILKWWNTHRATC